MQKIPGSGSRDFMMTLPELLEVVIDGPFYVMPGTGFERLNNNEPYAEWNSASCYPPCKGF
jgi:hypothetical protein